MKKLYEETAVQDIAAAIREKNGTATKYKVAEMGDAVRRCLNTGVETEVYTFDQCRAEVDRYLKNVTYNPSDYAVSQIPEYVTTVSANRPVGVDIVMKSAGTLTIVDGYTGNSVSQPVSAGAITIYNCTPGSISTFALLVDGKVIQQGVIKPTGACRMIHLLNVGNVRDLGGWDCDGGMVKYGLLFRGGEMYGYLTDDGRQQAIDMLGILKEIDLRFASELNGRTESGFGPTVDMLWVDMTWNDLSYQKSSGNIKAIFDPLFDYVIANKPTYFHCSAGADRTGVVALLCEAILGVSQSDCDKDYELSSFNSGVSTDAEARRRNETPWTREINYLNAYPGATFRDKVVNFMVSCGITIEKINAFRAAMIDGTPETVTADIATYSITKTLTDVTVSNGAASVQQYQPFVASITPTNGKLIESIKVTMGGKDVTAAVLRGSTDVLRRAVRVALTKCTSSNPRAYVIDGQSYCTAITADTGCEVSNVKIMMGGEDVSTFYKDGVIAIPEVIGDIVITATAVAQAPAYTNLLDAAIDMDGNVIGHTPMYKNMRYNSSSGAPVAHSGTNITGLLPVKKGDVVRIRWKGNTDISYQSIKFFKSDRTQVKVGYTSLANIEKGQAGPVINFNAANGVVCSKRLLNQAVGKSLRTHNLKPKKGAQVMRKNEKITALYERLSRDDFGKDDDQQRESNSISNQKTMLEEFAARQGFTNIVHFTDDGISGTCFDRPGFLAMMKEVEAGNVEYLCIKDMSRMGRDYLKVGQIMEILRQRGVRLIAINDGVDSARGDDDFTPFRNIMNEYYARDTSRKIRSTFQSKGKSGKHLTGTVIYGYLWNEARDQWLVDPEAAEVVKRIFAMTIDGYGPYQIASRLKEEKVLIPSAYLAQHGEGVNKNKTFKDVYGWGSSTICNILEKREYLGHTINFKTRKHFKDKKSHYVPEDEWTIFENTHEPIIDQQTFDLVQKIRGNVRRYPDGWGEAAPLTGLLYCADCGGKMYVHRTNNGKRISQYTCSQYSKVPVGKLCTTQHRINEDVVLSLVSEMLKAIAEYAKHDRAEFVRVVQEAQSSQQTAEVKKQRTRLATAKQRVSELEVLLCKIYEDNILGKLSDSRYATLDAQYEKEQSELTAEISVLEKAIKSYEKHEKDADRFIALIDKYENFDKLTIAMLNEFIEKILVHERDRKGSIQTTQEVEIYFNFVGRFVPPAFGEVELTPEELEEIRKREERKDRLHQNYLKRKANGKQKEYEERTKAKKKAEIEARKQAIRTEDIARGVFIPVSSLPQLGPRKGA